jgi:hypothetical protein
MKRLAALFAVAGLMVFASGALAGSSIKSTVLFDHSETAADDPSLELLVGHVESPSAKCLKNRTVKIIAFYGSPEPVPFDTAKTGTNGAFSGAGPAESGGQNIGGAKLKLAPKSIGTKKHPKTCEGDTRLAGG